MYGNPENKKIAKQKFKKLTQKGSAIDYIVQFQIYATQTSWNNKAIMLKYKKGLKLKVQNVFILIKDAKMMQELIN